MPVNAYAVFINYAVIAKTNLRVMYYWRLQEPFRWNVILRASQRRVASFPQWFCFAKLAPWGSELVYWSREWSMALRPFLWVRL